MCGGYVILDELASMGRADDRIFDFRDRLSGERLVSIRVIRQLHGSRA